MGLLEGGIEVSQRKFDGVDPDYAAEITQERVDHSVAEIRKQAAKIDPGQPGDCDLCGEWSARLVNGACAPCRDKYKLP